MVFILIVWVFKNAEMVMLNEVYTEGTFMSCLQYYILKILRYLGWIYGILEITTVIYLTDWYVVII